MTKFFLKLQLNQKFIFLWSKIACYIYLGLHKGHLSYRISLQPLKENIPNIKTWISLFFILFLWFIAVFLDLYWNLDKRKLYLGSVNLYWIIFKREQNILHVLICITVQYVFKKQNKYSSCEICYEIMCNLEQYIPHLQIIFNCNYLLPCYVTLFWYQ
jgi:hypothetical protein